jgi:hypothetical protein
METSLITRADMAAQMDVKQLEGLGKMLALSGYFERSGNMDQQVAQMCTKILAGREMGMGPFASVQGIYLIKGKLSFAANLISSAIKASGRYDYKVKKIDDTGCEIDFFEKRDGKWELSGTSTFNLKDAEKAGTQNMKAFPRNMMFARCMSNGQKWYAPDVFNGNTVYVPEELGASVDGDGNVIEVKAIEQKEVVNQVGKEAKAAGTLATTGAEGGGTHSSGVLGYDKQAAAVSPDGPEWQTWTTVEQLFTFAVDNGHFADKDAARIQFATFVKEFGGYRTTTKAKVHETWWALYKDAVEDDADQDEDFYSETVDGEAVEVPAF